MLLLVALSLAAGALALLISRSALLAPLRERTKGVVYGFVSCPFCVSFWLALGLVLFYGPPEELTHAPGLAVLAAWGGAALVAALADRD